MSNTSKTTAGTPTTNTSPSSPSTPIDRSTTNSTASKVVILRLPAKLLGRFPSSGAAEPDKPSDQPKPSPSSASTPTDSPALAAGPTSSPQADSVDGKQTPPVVSQGPDASGKKGGGAKTGTKRPFAQASDATSKPRSKPAPKKKARIDDIKNEAGKSGASSTNTGHKLGPKANQGAINAGLRALDRSGKPCRKWERRTFQLKSFTGVVWELPSWRAPKRPVVGDEAAEQEASQRSASKANESSVAMGSEKSNAGEAAVEPSAEPRAEPTTEATTECTTECTTEPIADPPTESIPAAVTSVAADAPAPAPLAVTATG